MGKERVTVPEARGSDFVLSSAVDDCCLPELLMFSVHPKPYIGSKVVSCSHYFSLRNWQPQPCFPAVAGICALWLRTSFEESTLI